MTWEVEEDVTHAEIKARRREGPGPKALSPLDHLREDYDHLVAGGASFEIAEAHLAKVAGVSLELMRIRLAKLGISPGGDKKAEYLAEIRRLAARGKPFTVAALPISDHPLAADVKGAITVANKAGLIRPLKVGKDRVTIWIGTGKQC